MQRCFHKVVFAFGERDSAVSDDQSQDILGDVLNAPRFSLLTKERTPVEKQERHYAFLPPALLHGKQKFSTRSVCFAWPEPDKRRPVTVRAADLGKAKE